MKTKTVWIGRMRTENSLVGGKDYVILKNDKERIHQFRLHHIFSMCETDFEKITGIKLKSGTKAKFKLVRVK